MKKVTVEFLYGGLVNEGENLPGVLFGDKVLVTGDGEIGLYNAKATANPGVYRVDLDIDGQDHSKMLLDYITA